MRTKANGININYELVGPEGAPTVMLSHSLSASLDMWWPQMAALSARYRVLRYDMRGHGESEAIKPPYTLEHLASDVRALLAALDINDVHFVGLSIGGMIGQVLATRHSDVLRSVTLCNTTSVIPIELQPLWDERVGIAESSGVEALATPTLERWFSAAFHERAPADVARIRAAICATSVDGYVGCCRAIQTLNETDALGAVRKPTLVIAGQHDPSTPPAASEVIRDRIEGSELVVLDAAHLSNVEQPAAFNDALLAFLDKA